MKRIFSCPGSAPVFGLGSVLGVAMLFGGAQPAAAHPHVWVDASADILFDEAGAITAIRQAWRFDEAFSSYLMLGLDSNGDGLYSREETAELAQVNVTSLADFHYFTSIAGAAISDRLGDLFSREFQPPLDYYLEHDGVQTTLHFTLPLQEPVMAIEHDLVVIDIYDPEFFVAFSLLENNPVAMIGAPDACALTLDDPPELDDSYASILSMIPAEEAVPEELLSVTTALANRARITCG
jgi:ABC-type uncharacterized transport system substrate-binding protein